MNTSSRRSAPRFHSCIALAALAVSVLALTLAPAPAKAQGSVAGDKAALEKLYDSTNGDSWSFSTNWKSSMAIGLWRGVTADATTGRVTSISLNNNNLTGTLPAELEDLTELRTLTINGNTGLGGSIPAELGNLPKLRAISFNGNDLDGAIPKELANLPLTSLVLDGNDLSGAIPKELGSLDMLVTLGLGDNELTGAIPEELGNLGDTLERLRLQGNSGLTGCVPHQLREVETQNIGNLQFCTIPTLVLTPSNIAEGGMTTVTATLNTAAPGEVTLTVSAEAVAPAEAGDFTLSDNRTLTIAMGQTASTGVVTITAVNNDAQSAADRMVTVSAMTTSSDNVPDPDSETLTITDDDRPRGIEADRAALKAFYAATGGDGWTMRDRWSDIDTLTDFNDLDGVRAYPDGHARAGRVNRLDFSTNNLIGMLPAELADLTELRDLFIVGDTGLTGPIPAELGTLPNLREINLRDNGLTGSIPAELADLPKLESALLLNGNDLTGPIPAELGKLDKLQSLQLQDNELSGDVPPELGDLADTLNVLRLRPGNSGLTGCVPASLRSVGTIEIGDLGFCTSPEVAADRAALVAFYDATNGDSWRNNTNWKSNMPIGEWFGVTTNSDGRVTDLVLRENLVTRSLPPELGELSELTVLRLDVNPRLTGEIPAELGRLPKLSVLHLNRNGLSGRIPLALGDLGDTLTELVLADNMPGLTGCVPYRLRNFAGTSGLPLTDICAPTTERVMVEPGGTVTYFIGERMVTVDATELTPADMGSRAEFRFPDSLTADLTLTLDSVPDNQPLPDENDFRLGGEDARMLVDITADPNPVPGGVEVCLPVTEALRNEAGNRQLLVLRYSGTVWGEASGSHRRDGDLVCASDVTAFSPFAVGYVPCVLCEDHAPDMKLVLAGVARTLASEAVDVVGGRFDAAPAGGGSQMTLAGHMLRLTPEGVQEAGTGEWPRMPALAPEDPAHAEWLDGPGQGTVAEISAQDLLTGSSFVLALDDGKDAGGASALTLWGRGSVSGFEGSPETGFDMDGSFRSGWLGLDYRVEPSLLVGLAVSHSTGTVDFERTGGVDAESDITLTSLLPYAHLQAGHGLEVWGMVGRGEGDMEVKVTGASTAPKTDLTSFMGAMGARQALSGWDGIDLAARMDVFAATLEAEAVDDLPKTRGRAQRARLLLEARGTGMGSEGLHTTPHLTLGGRWDGGTAETGVGLEAGGGVAWTHAAMGLSIELEGRYLLVHTEDDFDEWGASLDVRLDPGADGRGLSLSLSPVLGAAPGGAGSLHDGADVSGLAAHDTGHTGRLDAELAWGVAGFDGAGTVTPYGGLSLGGSDAVRYRLGSRMVLGTSLDLTVEGARTKQAGESASHGLFTRLRLHW